jgi:hypothetical protein
LNQSLIIPADDNVWLVRRLDQVPPGQLTSYLEDRIEVVAANPDYELARYELPALVADELAEFVLGDGRVLLRQAEISDVDNSKITMVTRWEQLGDPQPLKIFIHATDPDGQLIAQYDGLGVNWQGWLSGDTLVQVHSIMWPDNVPDGSIQLKIGLYDSQTGQRWLTSEGLDHIQLQE